jgi:hypothetical protein
MIELTELADEWAFTSGAVEVALRKDVDRRDLLVPIDRHIRVLEALLNTLKAADDAQRPRLTIVRDSQD